MNCLAPSVSIKDRPLLAVLIGDGTVLTAYREYEVVETGKPSTPCFESTGLLPTP